jgi:type I restriction enzyme M protein
VLDSESKRLIDSARNVLVGKIPDPKSQIEQITIALVFKFISDFAPDTAGMRSPPTWPRNHFVPWTDLMETQGNLAQRFALYSNSIKEISESPDIPEDIKKIFRNGQIPYEDPETLARFLGIIDRFKPDHIEQLGDALEYLFSLLGSQGTGGQFRTPSHLREFIVSIVNPKSGEAILDPACGTAGFLISAHRHISGMSEVFRLDDISVRDRKSLRGHFLGYDVSPEMVRLSLANLLLHAFDDPQVFEHDVLASEDHWGRTFDVIFANPPFMTPQGGISPHPRFPIAAKRAELLFLQYIVSHLTENGRAGVIVPEGVLFHNRSACREVRKMLVENALVAVVSLPSGCFNPYSEVRTSILFLDKGLARSSNTIGFFLAENDGFRLGRQRTRIDKDDLPHIKTEIQYYFSALRQNHSLDLNRLHHGQIVSKNEIGADGQFNLTHRKYQRTDAHSLMADSRVPLGDLVEFLSFRRRAIARANRKPGPYPYYGASGVVDYVDRYLFDEPLVLVGEDGAQWEAGEPTAYRITGKCWVNNHVHILRPRRDLILDQYLEEILNEYDFKPDVVGVTVEKLNQERLRNIRIPLPSIERQRRIIRKIESYRSSITEARRLIRQHDHKIRRLCARLWSR